MSYLSNLYRVRFGEDDIKRKEKVWKVLCEQFFQKFIPENATVLDIASGYGEFSRYIVASKKIVIDLNEESRLFIDKGTDFYLTSADNLNMIPDGAIDVCFSSNFFEHLPSKDAMNNVLLEAKRVLKIGGLYISMQPNIRYEPGKYWDYYDHILPLSHMSCREAFLNSGFEVVALYDKFIPFSTSSKLPQHPLLVKIYLKIRPLWRIFGGQFLLVARKIK